MSAKIVQKIVKAPDSLLLVLLLITFNQDSRAQDQVAEANTRLEEHEDDQQKPHQHSGKIIQLEDMLVTAQKREQNLQEVPISISILDGQKLDADRSEGVAETLRLAPSVDLYKSGQNSGYKLSIRGVTAGLELFTGSSTVGYYLDEVPWGFVKSAAIPDTSAYDLERVEIARGPQGTLYGASALNGVVRIVTKDADLNEYQFKMRTYTSTTEGSDTGNYRGDMVVNIPVIPNKLAFRAVMGYNKLGGWIDNAISSNANDGELRNLRLKINAKPIENLAIELSTWSSRSDFGGPSIAPDPYSPMTSPAIFDEPINVDYDILSATLNYDFPSFSLQSATSYIDYSSKGILDIANLSPLETSLGSEAFAQELHLVSSLAGPWQWFAGMFYRDTEDMQFQSLPMFIPAPINFTNTSESFAVFADISRSFFNGQFEVLVGLRYSEDDVGFIENTPTTGVASQPLENDERTFDNVSSRAVLTWFPKDTLTMYASYSEGFRSGFVQDALVTLIAPGFPALKEDTLANYEIGAKGSLLNDWLNFDAALYYIDWQDVQQTLGVSVGGGADVAVPVNAGSVSGVGVDLEMMIRPIEGLQLGFTLGWNDLGFDKNILSSGQILFEAGDRPNDSIETTLGLFADYLFPIGNNGYKGQLSGSTNYHSSRAKRNIDTGGITQFVESDEIVNTRLTFSVYSPKHWIVTAFVDNATNENGAVSVLPGSPIFTSRLRPRTIGLQLQYHY